MKLNMRTKNGYKSDTRASPIAKMLACTFLPYPQTFFLAQRDPILIKLNSFWNFLGVIKVHNPINRGPVYLLGGRPV